MAHLLVREDVRCAASARRSEESNGRNLGPGVDCVKPLGESTNDPQPPHPCRTLHIPALRCPPEGSLRRDELDAFVFEGVHEVAERLSWYSSSVPRARRADRYSASSLRSPLIAHLVMRPGAGHLTQRLAGDMAVDRCCSANDGKAPRQSDPGRHRAAPCALRARVETGGLLLDGLLCRARTGPGRVGRCARPLPDRRSH